MVEKGVHRRTMKNESINRSSLGASCCREKAHAVGCKEVARVGGKEGWLQGRAESAGGSIGVDLGDG
jgi:hypothetical protein